MKNTFVIAMIVALSPALALAGAIQSEKLAFERLPQKEQREILSAAKDAVFYSQKSVGNSYKIRATALNRLKKAFADLETEKNDSYVVNLALSQSDSLAKAQAAVNNLIKLHNAKLNGGAAAMKKPAADLQALVTLVE